jgi:hypothetical protein
MSACAFWAVITTRCRSSRSCTPFATTRLGVTAVTGDYYRSGLLRAVLENDGDDLLTHW